LFGFRAKPKLKAVDVGESTYIRYPDKITTGKNCKIGANCCILGSLILEDDVALFDSCDMLG